MDVWFYYIASSIILASIIIIDDWLNNQYHALRMFMCICWQVRIEVCGDSCHSGDPTIIVDFCQQGWVLVFIIAAEIYHVLGTVVYLLLGSGEEQWWAKGSGLGENVETTIRRTSSSFSFQPLKGRMSIFQRAIKRYWYFYTIAAKYILLYSYVMFNKYLMNVFIVH